LFLAVSLPKTADYIMHLPHYGGPTAVESFRPLVGLAYTCRSVVDNLLIGQVGISVVEYTMPIPLVAVVLAMLLGVGLWAWHQAPDGRRLILLGAGFIGSSYVLIYSARAAWGYEGVMTGLAMNRYHLFPQLGLALMVCGGLKGGEGRWFRLADELTRKQGRVVFTLIVACWLIQLPRGLIGYFATRPGQAEAFRRIDEVDLLCREHHIAAETARRVLSRLPIPGWGDGSNGYRFLRGSDDPRPMETEEARRTLGRS
jgi:hypothetical protein